MKFELEVHQTIKFENSNTKTPTYTKTSKLTELQTLRSAD